MQAPPHSRQTHQAPKLHTLTGHHPANSPFAGSSKRLLLERPPRLRRAGTKVRTGNRNAGLHSRQVIDACDRSHSPGSPAYFWRAAVYETSSRVRKPLISALLVNQPMSPAFSVPPLPEPTASRAAPLGQLSLVAAPGRPSGAHLNPSSRSSPHLAALLRAQRSISFPQALSPTGVGP
jgi:hypothetical protein